MPAHHRLGSHDEERLLPAGPNVTSSDPEQFVQGSKSRLGMLMLERGQLLAKGEVFQNQVAMRAKDTNPRAEPESKEAKHGREL